MSPTPSASTSAPVAPEPPQESEATATAEATGAPRTADGTKPDLGDLVISTSGLGPLEVGGLRPEENPGGAMLTWLDDACADVASPGTDPGLWVADYGQDVNYDGQTIEPPFFVAADDDGVHRIDVMGATPATEEGIHIGSTVPELQAAYPDLEGPFEGPVSQVWWIQDDAGSVAFETQGDADGLRPSGTPESVILIRVLAPDWPPEFATANSGDVAGACF